MLGRGVSRKQASLYQPGEASPPAARHLSSFCWPLREKFRDGFLFQRSQKPRQLIFTGTGTLKMESCMCVGWEHTYSIHTLNSKLYKIIMSFINTTLWNSDLNMFIATGFNPKSLIKPSISNPHLLAIWIPSTSFSSCSKTKKYNRRTPCPGWGLGGLYSATNALI